MKTIKELFAERDRLFEESFPLWDDYRFMNKIPITDIKSFIRADRKATLKAVMEMVSELKDKKNSCEEHREPRGVTANDYDCTDIHIGRREALSDLRTLLEESVKELNK